MLREKSQEHERKEKKQRYSTCVTTPIWVTQLFWVGHEKKKKDIHDANDFNGDFTTCVFDFTTP